MDAGRTRVPEFAGGKVEVIGVKRSEIAGDKLLEDVGGSLATANEASRALRLGASVCFT